MSKPDDPGFVPGPDHYPSPDDARTEVGNETRFAYRKLTENEKVLMVRFKQNQQTFIDMCKHMRDVTTDPEVKRCYSLAITKAEEGAMWAVRALTSPS